MRTVLYEFSRRNMAVLVLFAILYTLSWYVSGWQQAVRHVVHYPLMLGPFWIIVGAYYFLKRRNRERVSGQAETIWDEREEAVYYKALAWGFGASWIALVLAVGWFIKSYTAQGPEGITMVSLSFILAICFSILVLFFSLSVIVQKRGEGGSK